MLKTPHWDMLIVWYFFLGGIAGGAYFTAAIADNFGGERDRGVVRTGYLLSLPLVAACGLLLTIDLGVPMRFLNMLRRFDFWNPMSMGAWGLGVFGVFTLASSLLAFARSPERERLRRRIGLVGSVFGFFLASYTGVLLSGTAQPLWTDARLMGALFLASGASTGMAAIALLLFVSGQATGMGWDRIKRADRFAIGFEIVVLGLFVALLGAAAVPLTRGAFAPLFWGGLVGAGLVLPLVLQVVGHRVRLVGALSAALVLVGGFVLRYVVLMTVQS